jgi:hypothetical protein
MIALGLAVMPTLSTAKSVSDKEAQQIAKEAYIYGVPMVTVYSTLYEFSVDKGNPQYKGPFNSILNVARVFTPDDTAFVTPNSDTPLDLYTFNFDYVGSRRTGNDGGDFLIAGPGWKGPTPKGIKKVIRSETQLVNVVGRTQLFNPGDLDNVKKIQAGYKLQPLSQYLGKSAPPPAPEVQWIKPMVPAEQSKSLEFFNQLAFLLQLTSVNPAETALRKRFDSIGIVPGKPFDTASLPDSTKTALLSGMAEGQKEIDAYRATLGGKSADLFASRAFLKNNYLKRATGTQVGIGANSKDEALYPIYANDSEGKPLDGTGAIGGGDRMKTAHRAALTEGPFANGIDPQRTSRGPIQTGPCRDCRQPCPKDGPEVDISNGPKGQYWSVVAYAATDLVLEER